MDSKLREIEQRLAKAKAGLIEGGQDDYLQQLYLLDAEIRTVIKENGILPKAFSPRPRPNTVQRLAIPATEFGMSFGAVLLAATITYGAFQVAYGGLQPASLNAETSLAIAPAIGTVHASLPQPIDATPDIHSIQDEQESIQPTGELLVLAGLDANNNPATPNVKPSTFAANWGAGKLTSSPPTGQPGAPATIAASYIPPMVDPPVFKAGGDATQATGNRMASGLPASQITTDRSGFNWTIARFSLPGQAKKAKTEEIEVVNNLKEMLSESSRNSE